MLAPILFQGNGGDEYVLVEPGAQGFDDPAYSVVPPSVARTILYGLGTEAAGKLRGAWEATNDGIPSFAVPFTRDSELVDRIAGQLRDGRLVLLRRAATTVSKRAEMPPSGPVKKQPG